MGRVPLAGLLPLVRVAALPVVVIGVADNLGALALGAMVLVVLADILRTRLPSAQGGEARASLVSTVDLVFTCSTVIAFYAAGRMPA